MARGRVLRELRGMRLGLVAHPASVDSNLRHATEILRGRPDLNLTALFGPQHGWYGEAQDNMIESVRLTRVFSLYGKVREPTDRMLSHVDAIIVDMQDVGTRVYTFIQTLYLIMRACAKNGKPVVVLDRPNPIGDTIEGPMLDMRYASFVGLTAIPLRHGLTIGDLAMRYQRDLGTDLTVVRMKEYDRKMYFEETGLPWVLPSPNMPTVDAAVVYPGTVLIEGTSVSEGRGTVKPFEIIGAAGVDSEKLARELTSYRLAGAVFRPVYFQPTFNKHAGKLCGGVQIHVTDRRCFHATLTGVAVLKAFRRLDRRFCWKKPPYEYEYRKMPIDILAGGPRLREMVDRDAPIRNFRDWFSSDEKMFRAKIRAERLLN